MMVQGHMLKIHNYMASLKTIAIQSFCGGPTDYSSLFVLISGPL